MCVYVQYTYFHLHVFIHLLSGRLLSACVVPGFAIGGEGKKTEQCGS